MRTAEKPLPKFDKATGKWVVKNWDGTVAGLKGDERQFDDLEENADAATTEDAIMTEAAEEVESSQQRHTTPFARIDAVAAHSPAEEAGLQEGDLMLQFGPINHTNHKDMAAIGELVPEAAGTQEHIDVTILRNETDMIQLQLTPRPWNGRGLLGCHIVRYKPE